MLKIICLFVADKHASVMGETQGYPPTDRWSVHIHERSAVPSDTPTTFRGLDFTGK